MRRGGRCWPADEAAACEPRLAAARLPRTPRTLTSRHLKHSHLYEFYKNKAPVSPHNGQSFPRQAWTGGAKALWRTPGQGCIFHKVSSPRGQHHIQIPLTSLLPLRRGFSGDPALPALPHLPHNEFRGGGEGSGCPDLLGDASVRLGCLFFFLSTQTSTSCFDILFTLAQRSESNRSLPRSAEVLPPASAPRPYILVTTTSRPAASGGSSFTAGYGSPGTFLATLGELLPLKLS